MFSSEKEDFAQLNPLEKRKKKPLNSEEWSVEF